MAKQKGLSKVYVHAFLDGRDEPPASAAGFMKEAVAKLNEIGVGKIATISGRYYAMDRDNAWDRVEKAYDAMVLGEGVQTTADPVKAIEDSYANDVTDEFMLPTVLEKDGTSIEITLGSAEYVVEGDMVMKAAMPSELKDGKTYVSSEIFN